jgi:hypothetical protein
MRVLVAATLALLFTGCQTFSSQEQYILKLADKCEEISITSQQTKLKCPNYVDRKNGTSAATKNKSK